MRILFIGGTGIISSAAAALAVTRGHEITLLNRGASSLRPIPDGVEVVTGDIRDPASIRAAIGDRTFDVVADFVAFTPEQVQSDIDLFAGRTGQYVFISSASAYQKPVGSLPIRESSPLRNPYWQYSRDKIACEDLLMATYRDTGFPITIIRPSHTYDRTGLPVTGGWTVIDRMRRGLDVIVHGDGTSLWTLTHTDDFAKAFVGLLGLPSAIGEVFTITSDEAMPWNEIYTTLAHAAGVDSPSLVHVASETIALASPDWGPGLLGDKTHSVVFDNSKVKAFVSDYVATIPWVAGAAEIIDWFDADESRRVVDPATEVVFERLARAARLE